MTQTKAELLQTRHQGDIRLGDADSTHYVGFKAPTTVGTSLVWTLPAADGTANYLLKTDGSGNLGWVADSTTDSTKMPLAGGTFTGDVTFSGDNYNLVWDKSDNALEFADSAKATFGTGADLTIKHESNTTYATNITGGFYIQSNTLALRSVSQENYLVAAENGAVELYHDNLKCLETIQDGIRVLGREGNSGYIYLSADEGDDTADKWLQEADASGNFYLKNLNTNSTWETSLKAVGDGAVELYYDNSKKFESKATGAQISGQLQFSDGSTASGANKVTFGNSDDFQIYHDATNNRIDTYGKQVDFVNKGADGSVYENMLRLVPDGQIELYHNTVKKLETTSGGVNVVGAITVNGAALAGGGYASVQVFTTSTTWTKPSGIKTIRVTVIGAGGSGGRSNGIYAHGGDGGGAGGCAIETIDVTSVSSVSVTIGSGGAGQASPNNVGASGGSSSFGSYLSATGGEFGDYRDNQNLGGAGSGEGSGGDLNLKGGQGIKGLNIQNHSWQGSGGQAPVYGVVRSGTLSTGAGQGTTLSYGSGGAGACSGTSQAGSPGLVVVEEYK